MVRHVFPVLSLIILWGHLAGCAGTTSLSERAGVPTAAPPPTRIFAVTGYGWHTGIMVPAKDFFTVLPGLQRYFPDAHYLEFGWGDRDFYRARRVTSGTMFSAGLWPTEPVLYVTPQQAMPSGLGTSPAILLRVDHNGYQNLLYFLRDSFRAAKETGPLTGELLTGRAGVFFAATGHYHIFNTCNTWTARAIETAGFPMRTFMTLTADNVLSQLRPGSED